MASTTFYPTVDNTVLRTSTNSAWTDLVNGAGTGIGGNTWVWDWIISILSGSTTNKWNTNARGIFIFDTSSLPDGDVVSDATLSFRGQGKSDTGTAIAPEANVYGSTTASDTAIAAGDYQNTGSTVFSTAVTYASWSNTGYNDFSLNASGISNISLTGKTKFCVKDEVYDGADSDPTWSGSSTHQMNSFMVDNVGTGQDPKLVVTHAPGASFVPQAVAIF